MIILIIAFGLWLAYCVWSWFDWFVPRWEARTGRDWVTGEALEPDAIFTSTGERVR